MNVDDKSKNSVKLEFELLEQQGIYNIQRRWNVFFALARAVHHTHGTYTEAWNCLEFKNYISLEICHIVWCV